MLDAFYVHGTSKNKIFTEMLCFLNSVIKEFTWFHDWWLAKSWTPIVEQLFHSWSISLISGCLLWDTSLLLFHGIHCSIIGEPLFHSCFVIKKWFWHTFHDRTLNVPQMGGNCSTMGFDFFYFFLIEIIFFILWND